MVPMMEWFTEALAVSCTLLKREHPSRKLHFKDEELEAAVEKMTMDKVFRVQCFCTK
jgi:hypothetical protein